MKKLNRILSLLLALLLVVAVSGCSNKTDNPSGGGNLLGEGENAVTEAQLELQNKIKNKGGDITVLAPFTQKSLDGQCLSEQYETLCGGKLTIITEEYSNMQQKLATLHASGESPDIYALTNQDFPSLMYKNILTDLNTVIDFSESIWSNKTDFLNALSWDGANYFVPNVEAGRGLWWNKSLFEEAGIPEEEWPDALVESDNWTWDTFYDLEKRLTDVDNDIYGFGYMYNLCYMFPATTGEDIVSVSDGAFASNVTSANVTRSMNFMKKVMDPSYAMEPGTKSLSAFKNGRLAMYYDQPYIDGDNFVALLEEGSLGYTHFPRDPQSDTYCYPGEITGYAIPVGSKNVDAAVAFLEMFQATDYYQKAAREIKYENNNVNEEIAEFLENELRLADTVPLYSLGIKEIQNIYWGASMTSLMKDGATWESVSAAIKPSIELELSKLQ